MSAAQAYRPEIDGLRAIAVTAVVLFHAGLPGFGGGFVGVDVFFVISGYLITGILMREAHATGSIDLVAFYARRARRLLPAVVVMVGFTLLASWWFLPAQGERQALAASAVATLAFVSNVYFWRERTGYFAEDAEALPLLHTWTLSVEEQFYLVWPALLVGLLWLTTRRSWRLERATAILCLAGIVTSFALAQWLLTFRPNAAFFLAPARAFELAIGALLAAIGVGSRTIALPVPARPLAFVALGGILLAIMLIDGNTAWPGPASLLPVGATALLIVALSADGGGTPARLLSHPAMVAIGRRSYSWYLWHWPILSLLHLTWLGREPAWAVAVAVVASYALACLSFALVEEPIRRGRTGAFAGRWSAVGAGGLASIAGVAVAGGTWWAANQELASSPRLQAVRAAVETHYGGSPECAHYHGVFEGLTPWRDCVAGPDGFVAWGEGAVPEGSWVVWGDPHAHAMLPAFAAWAERDGVIALARTKAGCRPIPGPLQQVGGVGGSLGRRNCRRFTRAVEAQLAALGDLGFSRLFLVSRWPPAGERKQPVPGWTSDLNATAQFASRLGYDVTMVALVPEFPVSVPGCIVRKGPEACRLNGTAFVKHRARRVASAARGMRVGINVYDPADYLCTAAGCPVSTIEGVVLYKDDNHLSVAGARHLGTDQGPVRAQLMPLTGQRDR